MPTGTDVLVFLGMLSVTAVLVCLLHWLNDYLETRVPHYRRELEATYASFYRFLLAVRAAAVRGVRS